MAKGDEVEIATEQHVYVVRATKTGRQVEWSVEKENNINFVVATERTRGGTLIHEVRIPLDKAIAIVKQRAEKDLPE